MQLAKSIQNYVEFRNESYKGKYALEYWGKGDSHKVSRGVVD